MEKNDLAARAKKGDKKAFEALVEKYHDELYYTALGITRSGWDALDICQDTFLKAFSTINTLKDTSQFGVWINRILINKCRDFFRKNKKVVVVEKMEEEGFMENFGEDCIDLANALSTLSDEHREVLILRYFHDKPLKEIAAIVGCPEGTVKSRLSNGLKEMRRKLDNNKGKNKSDNNSDMTNNTGKGMI